MFHVEIKQFPNVARAFNLTADELAARIAAPWASEHLVELDERRFSPQKAKLTVYEGPPVKPEEMGLGRGWANVTRSGKEVTARVLDQARATQAPGGPATVQPFKLELARLAAQRPQALDEVLALAAATHPGRRVSEQLALAEQAVWELLHQGRARLLSDGAELPAERWQEVLLARESWLGAAVTLEA